MKPRPEERDEGGRMVLRAAVEHGLQITFLPNGEAMVAYSPDRRVIVYDDEDALGRFLVGLMLDAGGIWGIVKKP